MTQSEAKSFFRIRFFVFLRYYKKYPMKKTLILLVLTGLFFSSAAHPIDLETAQFVAAKFMATNDLQLVSTYPTSKNIAAFYIFNTADGFVIVSADDCETPIIAYSHEGRFNPNNVPVQMEDYLQDFVSRMQYGIENHVEADELTARQWELVKATGRINESKSTKAVAPLLTEKWHQGCLYNSLCPAMSGPCDHAEVGCVAVAMGQIMHYWKYPETGWGSNSYYHLGDVGAELSADFANTVYDWDHMPDSLTETSTEAEIVAVATLLFHCGVSIEMAYSTNGSSSNSSKIPNALMRYFDYSKHLHRESKSDFSNYEWLSMIKSDLDLQRPVQYSGSGSGGHAFVCDGYDDNDLLHFNWGWGGPGDGYFALGNLNPIGYQFSTNNSAIFGIVPLYEPWQVTATVYPPNAGTILGTGGYHIGESCTLTAVPAEQCDFYCWKRNGQVLTFNPTYTIEEVDGDIDDLVANFTLSLPEHITVSLYPEADNPNSPSVSLSWELQDSDQWTLLKEFNVAGDGVGTDGEYVYTSGSATNNSVTFRQYTMDGDLVEAFSIEGCDYSPALAFDGSYFYYLGLNNKLHCVDLANRTLVSIHSLSNASSHTNYRTLCVYDPLNDGFWIPSHRSTNLVRHLTLISRSGQSIREGPSLYPLLPLQVAPWGSCYHTAKDETRHLLFAYSGKLYDYNITNDILCDHSIADFQHDFKGACIGQYDGKESLFIVYQNKVHIYEINCHLSQIVGYRIYRSNSEGDTVMLADGAAGNSYIDHTWDQTIAGIYRFGISEVYFNGVESEIIWSEPIEKTDIGIDENQGQEMPKQKVQKVFEDGKIVIIKNGKRYTITGQLLN
jgi:hypothetical protein